MDLETIKILKERAKAKMENRPTKELTDIDIYTAIAEWERETKENKALWKIIYDNKLEDLFHKKLERRRILDWGVVKMSKKLQKLLEDKKLWNLEDNTPPAPALFYLIKDKKLSNELLKEWKQQNKSELLGDTNNV